MKIYLVIIAPVAFLFFILFANALPCHEIPEGAVVQGCLQEIF